MGFEKPQDIKHNAGDDDTCPICTHPQRSILERLYIDCEPMSDLEGLAQVHKDVITVHGYFLGLQDQRMDNTKRLYGKIVCGFVDNFDPKKVTAHQAMAAARQLDLIQGRVNPDINVNVPQVTMLAPPMPGAGQDRKDAQTIEGSATEVLPMGAGQNRDDAEADQATRD